MTIYTGQDGTKVYCSGLLGSERVEDIFSHSMETVGATIRSAAYKTDKVGKHRKKFLHFDVTGDNDLSAGLSLTDQTEINGFFLDLAGIKHFKYAWRLKGRRVDARFRNDYLAGVSVPIPEPVEET